MMMMPIRPRIALRTVVSHLRRSKCTRAARPGWRSASSHAQPQPSIGLAEQLRRAIDATGPLPVAKFMRQCLTSMDHGYYSRSPEQNDQIGRKGDFVTSPEISQVFGELVGIWIVSEWMAQGKKSSGVHLVELGPGRGTLMDDILRTIKNFPPLFKSLEGVTLVESSANLREVQSRLLCPQGSTLRELPEAEGYQSRSKHSNDLKINWIGDPRFIPSGSDTTPFVIAHEFFDALPIHIFQSVEVSPNDKSRAAPGRAPRQQHPVERLQNRWRELLVDNKSPTLSASSSSSSPSSEAPVPEFQLRLANRDTPHSLLLPLDSPRYDALRRLPTPGATVDISPDSISLARRLAALIDGSTPTRHPAGAALIVDYGPASGTIPANTLRGVRAHRRVPPLERPGETDISADVDFGALADAALAASPRVEVHGPVPQAAFLRAMGGEERVRMLARRADGRGKGGEETRERIEGGWERLVDTGPAGMGGLYKAMAIVPRVEGSEGRRPVGFGGEVVGG